MWRIKGGQSSPAKHTACYRVAIVSCKCEGVNCCNKHSALHFHCVNCNGGAGKERRANSCELLPAHSIRLDSQIERLYASSVPKCLYYYGLTSLLR